jgi:polyisoprenoid-binding protein YceI
MRELPDAVTTWSFEPGHTEAEFRARHMMVTWVRGLFKDIHGKVELHREDPLGSTFGGEIDATGIWTGEPDRDAHLRSADFLDVENHPAIAFRGRFVERTGDNDYRAVADLTLRGVTREVSLEVAYLGQWATPYWVGDESRGEMRRLGFEARTVLNRHDFGVSWQDRASRRGSGGLERDQARARRRGHPRRRPRARGLRPGRVPLAGLAPALAGPP